MPKYRFDVVLTATFDIDTDDYVEEFKEQELDTEDEDVVHDFIRECIENDGITEFDSDPAIDQMKVEKLPEKKK